MDLAVGDSLRVRALHADGQTYRWWEATVEAVDEQRIVTYARAGHQVHGLKGSWASQGHIRAYYWRDRPYNLLEVYRESGQLAELYINVASPPVLDDHILTFVDHELDVTMAAGGPARLVDEDEFAAAITLYGYSPEFQAEAYRAAHDALELARGWQAAGMPPQ